MTVISENKIHKMNKRFVIGAIHLLVVTKKKNLKNKKINNLKK